MIYKIDNPIYTKLNSESIQLSLIKSLNRLLTNKTILSIRFMSTAESCKVYIVTITVLIAYRCDHLRKVSNDPFKFTFEDVFGNLTILERIQHFNVKHSIKIFCLSKLLFGGYCSLLWLAALTFRCCLLSKDSFSFGYDAYRIF